MSAGNSGAAVVGDPLAPFTVPLTLQRLVMEAAANRDFAPIHHDPAAARASGAPGVYANTTFVETMLEAVVRAWAGHSGRIRVLEFSMLSFNCVGDEVSAGGVVTECSQAASGERTVELELWIDGPRGRTVSGAATVSFPPPPPPAR